MISNLNRQTQLKSKLMNNLATGLTTAQMTIRQNNQKSNGPQDSQIQKTITEADALLKSAQPLQAVNKLRKLKESVKNFKNKNLQIVSSVNLGVSYYQVGFLEEAFEELNIVALTIKELVSRLPVGRPKVHQRIHYEMLNGKVQLQTCILFSEMGNHDTALQHAKSSVKIHYDLVYDTLIGLYARLNSIIAQEKNYIKSPDSQIKLEHHANLLNNISILAHLTKVTKDLKASFFSRDKAFSLSDEVELTKKYGRVSNRISIQALYGQGDQSLEWIFKNKILDQIQLKTIPAKYFESTRLYIQNSDIIERIAFLVISLYCFSTETRFLEKQKASDPMDVLDSQHWLSRSLEIAYMFMPPQAPILNQILTVHDRFHGIDKQTIPQDKEVSGFFKVLRPLGKPKSTYSSKSPMCSPILIRIQASKQLTIDVSTHRSNSKQSASSKNFVQIDGTNSHTIELQSVTKNNKIRGMNNSTKLNHFIQFGEIQSKKMVRKTETGISTLKSVYSNRKSSLEATKNDNKLKLDFTGLASKIAVTESLRRPHSYDKQINKIDQPLRLNSERKRKTFSMKKKQIRSRPIVNSATLKLDGFQLMPPNGHRKYQENQQAFDLFDKMNVEARLVETKINGNVFINNNINLFISKGDEGLEQLIQKKQNKTSYQEIGRRQNFMNKRKAKQAVFGDK